MKKIFIILSALLICGAAFAKPKLDETVRAFFPPVANLSGGEEHWLSTGISEKDLENSYSFATSYSYYSPDAKKLMNIKRKKTFDVNAKVHVFNNFVKAYDKYHELTNSAPKDKTQKISFGDRGIFYYIPHSGYINDADFSIIFLNKIFVAEIHADDGFALMDVAANMNINMQNFVLANIEFFLVKNLTLAVSSDGFGEVTEVFGFAEESPKEVVIEGKVFDENMSPLSGIEITVLETGQSIITALDGSYKYSVALDGDKSVKVSRNFYLKKINQPDKALHLSGGVYSVKSVHSLKKTEQEAAWQLEIYSDSVFGRAIMETPSGKKIYPLKGTLAGGKLTLSLDCQTPGTSFKCGRTYEGFVTADAVKGTWSGTGGTGTWALDRNSYAEAVEYIYLEPEQASLKKVNVSGGKLKITAGAPSVSANDEGVTGILFNIDKDALNINEMFLKSAALVLSHLPLMQGGELRLFRYDTEMNSNGSLAVSEGSIRFAGDVKKADDVYETEADITDYLNSDTLYGVLLSPLLQGVAGSGNHVYGSFDVKPAAYRPKLKLVKYVPSGQSVDLAPVKIRLKSMTGKDMAGSKNVVRPDGEPDIVMEAVIRLPGKKITSMEITGGGDFQKSWNTDPLDIYPVIGFISGERILNSGNGSVNILNEKPSETYELHLAPLKGAEADKLRYRIVIGGVPYEGTIGK